MTASGVADGRPRGRVALPAFTPTARSGAELAERTVGREDLIQRIVDFLRTAATSRDRPHVLVVGPRGSGKTHLLAVVLHRARQDGDIARRLAFAWVPEDAVGISSYEDLLVATVEHLLDGGPRASESKQATLDDARRHRAERDPLALEQLVRSLLDGRVLVLVLENLDRVFGLLGESGQARLRGFTETTGELLLVASTPLLFDAVSKRNLPWFGSFAVEHLDELSVEDGGALLERIAREDGDGELAHFLTTDEALARLRAVAHLAGGSPRMWMILAGCMTVELIDELVPLVEAMLDQLAPYYQQRLWELPPIEQKLVAELCRTATLSRDGQVVHEQRGMRTVADLATVCGVDQRVAATALGRLLDARWVRRSKPPGTDRRTTWYEVREPLLRHYLQYRETRGEPLRVIVGFLRAWYAPHERLGQLVDAEPGSLAELYLSRTAVVELGASDALFCHASPEHLIAGARCVLDDEPRNAGLGLRGPSAAIVAEAVGLDAWRGREHALHACRSRLRTIDLARARAAAEVLAAALTAAGERVSAPDVLESAGYAPGPPPVAAPRPSWATVRTHITSALIAAVPVADARLELRERVELRLLTAGWMGACGAHDEASALLEQTAPSTGGLGQRDVGLRLAVEAELALFAFVVGRREQGRAGAERVFADRLSLFGPDHPDTLTSRENLAYFVGSDGDQIAARDLYARLAADRARVLGVDHPSTLHCRDRHAYYVREAGDLVAARVLYAGVVADHQRVLGADHPKTWTTRHEHAVCLARTGEWVAARELFAVVSAGRERVLGGDHPGTLLSRHWHAYYVARGGDPAAAAIIAAEVLERSHRARDPVASTPQGIRSLFVRLAGRGAPARSMLLGDAPQLSAAADAVLRLDSALASDLLAGWCELTNHVDEPRRSGAVARVCEMATGAGRATELGVVLLRALRVPGSATRRRWTAAWLAAIEGRDELAVAHRMLGAASAALDGDATARLALPAEEQRIVDAVLRLRAGEHP